MKATLKILVPLAVMAAVIFGVTFFSQYAPPTDDGGGKAAGAAGGSNEPPLRVFSSTARWDPNDDNLSNRTFPGFFEAGTEGHSARFWFENRNEAPVRLQLKHVSCSACSSAGAAAVPAEALRSLVRMDAITALPFGPLPVSALGPMVGAAGLLPALQAQPWQWKSFKDDPNATFDVPAAPPGGTQWGVLQLNFQARFPADGPRNLTGDFVAQVVDRPLQVAAYRFVVSFVVTTPFDVATAEINLGELTEDTPARDYEIVAYSTTRDPADFPPPQVTTRDAADSPLPAGEQFIAVRDPVLMAEPDRARLAGRLAVEQKRPVRVRTAYRIPVSVVPKLESASLDIGPVERVVWLAGPGQDAKKVRLTGTVKGGIGLADGAWMELGSFSGTHGVEKRFRVVVEKAGEELAWVKGETRPDFLDVKLTRQSGVGERGAYEVRVRVPPGEKFGHMDSRDSVVLTTTGPNPRRIRIPLRGNGTLGN